MADILALRTTMRNSSAQLAIDQGKLEILITELMNVQAGDGLPSHSPIEIVVQRQVFQQQQVVRRATAQLSDATAAYQAAVAADPMNSVDSGLPLVLLPVRIETAYLPSTDGSGGTDLVVRVYPDDIHVNSHEPELTALELAAGTTYWQAVWGAGPNQSRLDAAWSIVLSQLKPQRAAWSVEALAPSVPRPATETPIGETQPVPPLPTVPTRPTTFNRAPHTELLPDHWHVIGYRAGQELFNVDASPIPSPLDVSFGPPGTGASDSNLPFDAKSKWLVDLDSAIAMGMAVRITMPGPDYSVDQLFVLGVSSAIAPADAENLLQTALIGHQYTDGLAFLPPGTPTNNTPETRSAWDPAPQPPSPTDVENARAAYLPASNQNAALAGFALGIDGTQALCIAPDGLDDQQSDIAILTQNLWPALGRKTLSLIYTNWVVAAGNVASQGSWQLNANFPQTDQLGQHFLAWVRSRGTLPVLRVGNEPYGLLPALSLNDWVTDPTDPTVTIVNWTRILRDYWSAGILNIPFVQPQTGTSATDAASDPVGADSTVVSMLQRLPVSVDIVLRADGDPMSEATSGQNLPVAPIPSLSPTSQLYLSVPNQSAVPFPVEVVSDAAGDQTTLQFFQQIFHDGLAVLQGTEAPSVFQAKYKSVLGAKTLPGAPPADLFYSMIQDGLTDPLQENNANFAGSMAGFIICAAYFYDPTNQKLLQTVQETLPQAELFSGQWDLLCQVNPSSYESGLREILDTCSHRLDAWITSLAARRLGSMRSAKPSGLVLGAYGWVENLAPRTDLTAVMSPPDGLDNAFTSPEQKYIHAPSLQHAATAAVLRAGYDSHDHPDALAVNLVSSRVRIADWLAEGVRSGQTAGALLGYRFERGLQDAGLDIFVAPLRASFGIPLPTGADNDVNAGPAKTAILARNVVDGLALYRNLDSVYPTLQNNTDPNVSSAANGPQAQQTITSLLGDLTNTLDAFGDLLLAESVHHAVGGNPIRAGAAADMLGGGGSIPYQFDVVTTPRSGRPLTWQIGALFPAGFASPSTGWTTNRPRAIIEPNIDAWAASILGPASSWQIACTVTSNASSNPVTVTLDTLGIAATDVVEECPGSPSQLELRVIESLAASQPAGSTISVVTAPSTDGSLGFAELRGFVQRLKTVLGNATATGPQSLQGANSSPVVGLNITELDGRVAALQTSFAAAVQGLDTAIQGLQAASGSDVATATSAEQSLRAAMIVLADHGIPVAWPLAVADGSQQTIATLTAQAQSLLAATQPTAAQSRPSAPALDAADADVTRWLTAVSLYVNTITNSSTPILPTYSLPAGSDYATAFAPGSAPTGADVGTVMAWLRRTARLRTNTGAMHDALVALETLQGTTASLTVAQLPISNGDQWAALPFSGGVPPAARLAHVLSTPIPIDPSVPFCGFICDSWTELVPGLTTVADSSSNGYEHSEVTGLAFTVEAPSAFAPQSILLAVIPDQSLNWSLDLLFDTVQETLALAKIRSVDLGDLPRLGRILPAIHSGYNVDQLIQAAGVPA